ncbi:MAG: winged helix-turn-helix transcriptional regulator [Deltaproteobacteria bacterium]|nr:winged helix-turn-helix transcriptional regulator [Deltaproteobacteria bacterium]
MKKFLKITKVLSDKNRVKILKMLQYKELCVCEIQEGLRLAQPTVSNHLKILEDAELINYRKEGLWVNYFLNNKSDNPYISVFLKNLKYWLEADEEVAELVKVVPELNRQNICKKKFLAE